MTFSDHIDDAGRSGFSGGAELYGIGPWLIIESIGSIAQELADQAVAQCEARGVRYERVGIDDLPADEELGVFHGLVVTVPDAPTTESDLKTLVNIAKLIRRYRGSGRGAGIRALLSGAKPEYKVGILQIAGRAGVLNSPQLRKLEQSICRAHRIDPKSTPIEVDFFSIYHRVIPAVESQAERNMQAAWDLLEQWNITDPDTVLGVHRTFLECIQYFNDDRFDALKAPVPDSQWNRLQYMLFEPDYYGPIDPDAPEQSRKNWVEAGARCGRHVLSQLESLDPDIKRPRGRRSGGQQRDLHILFTTVDTLIRTDEFHQRLSPPEVASQDGDSAPPAPAHD